MQPTRGPADRRIAAPALARLVGRHGEGPAYLALAEGVRRAILDGSLPLSTRLPSERELAAALHVSRTTTAAAYERLREQGFVSTRRGSGSVSTIPSGPRPTAGALSLFSHDDADTSLIDLTKAAPAAPAQLHGAAMRALEALPRHLVSTGYTFLGLTELREVIADRYTRRGTPTSADEVLVTSGAQQAISLLLNTLVGPGDRVVVEHPTYPNTIGAVRAAGGRPVPVPVGAGGLDLDLLESTVRQSAPRLVHLTPDHHNPTGTSLDDAARARVRDLAARHRIVLVGDETLTDLTLDGDPPASFTGSRTQRGVAVVGSASKSMWGGLRIGWVRAHRDLVTRLATARAADDISTAVLDQLVAAELLADDAAIAPGRTSRLRAQRDTLHRALARALPWRVPLPAGGLSMWADLGAPVSTELAELALRHGVRVVPGPAFGVDGSFEDRLRLPFALPPEQLEEGVARLALAWRTLGTAGRRRPVPAQEPVV
ncbi:PLP-dependent aminotransferase family protein [Cellulomonas sp. APG4]|uniref:MocR-like transcription factor YczR n=1 Tax=Cellulomonas sp. APG4 TaxID=1538656 RepID=UPI00351ADFA2